MPRFQTEAEALTAGQVGAQRSILTQWCRDPPRFLAPHCLEESPESSQWRLASPYLVLALREVVKDKP